MRPFAFTALVGVLLLAGAGCARPTPPAGSPPAVSAEHSPLRDRLMRVALGVIESSGHPPEAFSLGELAEFVDAGAAELARRSAPEAEIRKAEERLRDLVIALGPAAPADSTAGRGAGGIRPPDGAKSGKKRLCPLYPFC